MTDLSLGMLGKLSMLRNLFLRADLASQQVGLTEPLLAPGPTTDLQVAVHTDGVGAELAMQIMACRAFQCIDLGHMLHDLQTADEQADY